MLDEPVVEVWHAHLQRVGHRHPVGEMEHVVRERELAVHEERLREPIRGAGRRDSLRSPVGQIVRPAMRAAPDERTPKLGVRDPAHCRAAGRSESRRGQFARSATGWAPPRASGPVTAGANSPREECRRPQHRRGSVLVVASVELVRPLSAESDRHMLRRELAERVEAQRREIGDRLVKVPEQFPEIELGFVDRELQLVVRGADH